jgi:hypothetical protein
MRCQEILSCQIGKTKISCEFLVFINLYIKLTYFIMIYKTDIENTLDLFSSVLKFVELQTELVVTFRSPRKFMKSIIYSRRPCIVVKYV